MRIAPTRILLVDNPPEVCARFSQELRARGCQCTVASRPGHAKRLLAIGGFGLMICGIVASGLDLLAHIRQRGYRCKVILLADATRREHVAQALMLGAYDYLERPLRDQELIEAVVRAASEDDESLPRLPVRAAAAMELSELARQAALGSVHALVRAVEAKDPYTRRHSEQVAHYAVKLAVALALPEEMVQSIRTTALLHDVGKIGVPDGILTKPGPLTKWEWSQVRMHPVLGADILANISLFREEARFVRHHHERWDGKGYPDGLRGKETPLECRIVQTADCIDAMLVERIYKHSYAPEMMIQELARGAGTQFDPELAAVAVRWCRAHRHELILPTPTPSAATA